MFTRYVSGSVIATLGLVSLFACNRDRDHQPVTTDNNDRPRVTATDDNNKDKDKDKTNTTTITGANVGGTVGNTNAIERIVASRCAREQSCSNVGVDKKYANTPACTAKLRADMKDDLNAKDCPRGIDAKELNECLDEIRKESCNNPIDTINRLAACRTSDLCLNKHETENR
jgi:hypothetical protein